MKTERVGMYYCLGDVEVTLDLLAVVNEYGIALLRPQLVIWFIPSGWGTRVTR